MKTAATMRRPRPDHAAQDRRETAASDRGRSVDGAMTRTGAGTRLSLSYLEQYLGKRRAWSVLSNAGLLEEARAQGLDVVDFWQVCADNIVQLNDEAHGIAKHRLPRLTWGSIYSGVNQMDCLAEGLERFAELVAIIPTGVDVAVGHPPGAIQLTFSMKLDGRPSVRGDLYLESVALVFHCVLMWVTGKDFVPIRARTSTLIDGADGTLLNCMGCPVSRKGTGVTLTYDRGIGAYPLGVRKYKSWAAHETAMFRALIAMVAAPQETASETPLAAALARLLLRQPMAQEEAARELCMSASTMKRRLALEGTSFRKVSRDLRLAKLRDLLDSGEKLDDIAVELGLSDRRSLWRSCNSWLGMSPDAYRRSRLRRRDTRDGPEEALLSRGAIPAMDTDR